MASSEYYPKGKTEVIDCPEKGIRDYVKCVNHRKSWGNWDYSA